jgi:hypothetical protein
MGDEPPRRAHLRLSDLCEMEMARRTERPAFLAAAYADAEQQEAQLAARRAFLDYCEQNQQDHDGKLGALGAVDITHGSHVPLAPPHTLVLDIAFAWSSGGLAADIHLLDELWYLPTPHAAPRVRVAATGETAAYRHRRSAGSAPCVRDIVTLHYTGRKPMTAVFTWRPAAPETPTGAGLGAAQETLAVWHKASSGHALRYVVCALRLGFYLVESPDMPADFAAPSERTSRQLH